MSAVRVVDCARAQLRCRTDPYIDFVFQSWTCFPEADNVPITKYPYSMLEPDSMTVQNFIPGVHSVSTIRCICEDPASSIDPPDQIQNMHSKSVAIRSGQLPSGVVSSLKAMRWWSIVERLGEIGAAM